MSKSRITASAAAALVSMAVVTGAAVAGCGSARHKVKTVAEEPSTWHHRGIWTEKQGDRTLLLVVGSSGSATLDRSSAMEAAEQVARERLAIYLGSTVQAFRERLARRRELAVKRIDDDDKVGGAELTSQNDSGGRTVAERAIRGLEFANSHFEEDSDTLFVLGRLDLENFRKTLLSDRALSEVERDLVTKNAAEIRAEMDAALEDARRTKP
jgi:hypothetical protein